MGQSLSIKIRGLYTSPNDFSSVPDGSLAVADNIVIDRESIAEPRRGFTYLAKATGIANFIDSTDRCLRVFFYRDSIVAHVVTSGGVHSLVYFDPTAGWGSSLALFNQPLSTVKVRSALANGNLYLTGDLGVHRMSSITSVPIRAGVPQAADIFGLATSLNTPTWLVNTYSVAYRLVWGYKDINGNLFLGAPSGRYVITNSAGVETTVKLSFNIPYGITTSHFYQIYRSSQVVGEPSTELRLVYEGFPTAGDLVSGAIEDLLDIASESFNRGAALYTNISQEGDENANIIPPKALDIASFRDCMFYANIRERQTIFINLMSVDFSHSDTDTVTVGSIVLKAIYEDKNNPDEFSFTDSFTDPVNVRTTAKNIVETLNDMSYRSSGPYTAVYLSGVDDDPGKIVIYSNVLGAAPFAVTSTKPSLFTPAIPSSPAGAIQYSSDDYAPNGIAYSKVGQPESVPLSQRTPVGGGDFEILRMIALRDAVFILKEDGIFRLYGTDPTNFQVAMLDSTAICIAPDSAVVLNNMIFALTTQGVVTISDTGVIIMSEPIKDDLLDLLSINKTVLAQHAFGVASESQRAYYLWVPTLSTDTYPTQYFRYCTVTKNWTRGTMAKICGGVNPYDDLMYLGDATHNFLDKENKSHTSADYADYVSTGTITAVLATTVAISNASTLVVGQVIYQEYVAAVKTAATGTGGGFEETTDVVTISSHGYLTGQLVTLSGTTLPTGLSAQDYYVVRTGTSTFKLAATYALAIAGTGVNFTTKGATGTATFTPLNYKIWGEVATVATTTVTTKYETEFLIGSAVIVAPIDCRIKWNPATFANPGVNKQIRETSIFMLSDFYGSGEVTYESDISPETGIEPVVGIEAAPFGLFPFGGAPWGGYGPRRRPMRVMVPRIHQRCSFISVGFNHQVCFSPWAIQGISLIGNNIGSKLWQEGDTI